MAGRRPSETAHPFPGGRVPFRIRIGVTGHRSIDEYDQRLARAVAEQVERIAGLVRPSPFTDVKLSVVSALAEGGDRIVTRAVLAHAPDARLEVVLPLEEDDYAAAQQFADDAARRKAFDDLLRVAASKRVLHGPWARDDAAAGYEAAGRYVARRCDVLIALWDGKAQRGRGGTAPTLLDAAEFGRPCIWVPSEGAEAGLDNLRPGSAQFFLEHVRERVEGSLGTGRVGPSRETGLPYDTLARLREGFERLDGFNSRYVSEVVLSRPGTLPDWAASPFERAGALARRFQRWFLVLTWLMAVLATGAALTLGLGLSFASESVATAVAEIGCLALLLFVFAIVKIGRFHQRWLSCRLLAERLRTAAYVSPTGFDSLDAPDLKGVFVEEAAADWSIRAFEEVWHARPREAAPRGKALEDLQHALADRWIQGQIDYHEAGATRHALLSRCFLVAIVLLFGGTLAFPILHAIGVEEKWAILCSITLPAAGASLGAILTVRQHHALVERYRRMRGDLVALQDDDPRRQDAARPAERRGGGGSDRVDRGRRLVRGDVVPRHRPSGIGRSAPETVTCRGSSSATDVPRAGPGSAGFASS